MAVSVGAFALIGDVELVALKCALEMAMEHDEPGRHIYNRMLKRLKQGLPMMTEPEIQFDKEAQLELIKNPPCHLGGKHQFESQQAGPEMCVRPGCGVYRP